MPYKDLEKRKEIKRLNYIKNAKKIKRRTAWNKKKSRIITKILSYRKPVFTDEQVEKQNAFIKNVA